MFVRALKSNVIISLAVFLFIGMVLIDFVVVRTFQRQVIQTGIDKGTRLISIVENEISYLDNLSQFPLSSVLRNKIQPFFNDKDIPCARISSPDNRHFVTFGQDCGLEQQLEEHVAKAVRNDQRQIDFSGSVWGVFWWQRQHVILSAPLSKDGRVVGGMGVVHNLEPMYQDLRKSQKFVFIYLFINIVILTFIGFHRLFKIFLEPIERLAKRAENYQESDGLFFPVRKQDNELQVLSKSLNSMTRRITEDKHKLKAAVHTLEKTNVELSKAQEEIIRAEKLASVGRLSSGIAHEIGNPIGIIMGYLELLKQEGIQAQEKAEYISRTEQELHRMDTVIRQMLDLSRPLDAGSEMAAAHEIVDDIAKVLNVQPLMSNIELSLCLEAESDQVRADPNQLRQVFLNLAINAADAVSAERDADIGHLEIRSRIKKRESNDIQENQSFIEIVFADNGPGIAPDVLENIFDPFFTTKEPGKGTGLGLYVCFMIIDALGGSIHAHNRDGQGAEMTISLPLAE
jgi:two-component system, NtrC family, sensor kinase